MIRTVNLCRYRKERLVRIEVAVETFCQFPTEFHMLCLVLADRHMCSSGQGVRYARRQKPPVTCKLVCRQLAELDTLKVLH
jgi:hypothetical protein